MMFETLYSVYIVRFDADTAVPSRRDGQVEAFSACLAAQSCLQDSLLATMRGNTGQVSKRSRISSSSLCCHDPLLL